jgi:replication factor C large subunit
LRSAINDLQSLCLGKKRISEKDVTVLGHRDSKSTIFKVISEIFKATSYKRALESTYDLDEDLNHLLLWIDENLPVEYKKSEDLGRAYLPLSKASIYLGRVRRRQFYKFWSYANDMMTAGVALSKTNVYQGYTKYQFPSWLTKMSKSKGIRSTRKSLNGKLSSAYHTSQYVAQTTMYPYLKYLFENEREFTLYSIRNLDLDSEEIAFILEESVDSAAVRQLLEESKAIEEPKSEKKERTEGLKWSKKQSTTEEAHKEGEKGQKELSDF